MTPIIFQVPCSRAASWYTTQKLAEITGEAVYKTMISTCLHWFKQYKKNGTPEISFSSTVTHMKQPQCIRHKDFPPHSHFRPGALYYQICPCSQTSHKKGSHCRLEGTLGSRITPLMPFTHRTQSWMELPFRDAYTAAALAGSLTSMCVCVWRFYVFLYKISMLSWLKGLWVLKVGWIKPTFWRKIILSYCSFFFSNKISCGKKKFGLYRM